MRTTLRIDDDVLLAVRERAAREKRTAGEVLSELARQGLTGPPAADAGSEPGDDTAPLGFRPLPRRGPIVSRALIDALLDEELA